MEQQEALPNLSKRDRTIAKAIDKNGGGGDDTLVTLSTGVVLRVKQANPHILIRIMTASPRPKPPVYFNTTMGREMENPDSPDYIAAVKAWEMEYNNGMLNALIGLGTELVSVPKGMEGPHPKSNGKVEPLAWVRDYQVLGLPVLADSPAWRYITWVLFKAAVLDSDTKLIGDKVRSLSGVQEADVQNAETFSDGDKE